MISGCFATRSLNLTAISGYLNKNCGIKHTLKRLQFLHTFKSANDIKAALKAKKVDGDKPIVTYCHSGDRAAHMYFAIKYVAGIDNVKIYDGSWLEWASLVALPVQQLKK
ncbi:MAG: Rhodanese domain protein [Deferribacteraceae bacterium]|jgi:thiosulfate/3-mercaptopyruvate sulfurtransferase|nr:Rhodanese domain protein [Deferribacteraceae bacterium]